MTPSLIPRLAMPALLLAACTTANPPQSASAPPLAEAPAAQAAVTPAPSPPAPTPPAAEAKAPTTQGAGSTEPPSPEALYVYFPTGSAHLGPDATAVIDQAARLYREGNPFKMMVAGYTDATGDEFANLVLSARRAEAVKKAMVGHGIPPQRLDVQARGESDPKVATENGVADAQNRRVVITWR